ncbi:hypothetical protein [Streptomyces flavofungini]|uniref:hypothetical protein n=1 Tax=Streptomyces flavofungini TaxID=68200 RepID=UPI0025B21EE4|nr:hypothetical protein [Streptomyces flavofungini]WJV48933.1 hypothetical protein QUY26_27500 [Streptomyces flavofungini]
MTDPFSLAGIRQRLSAAHISSDQADRLAEVIVASLQETCASSFPGANYDNWRQMLPESLLDLLVEVLAWTDDGLIAADPMPTGAASRILEDLWTKGLISPAS